MRTRYISLVAILGVFLAIGFAASANQPRSLGSYIASIATPFSSIECLDYLTRSAGNRELVLLGEASHGTHEYYHWRSLISKELIVNHGFDFIAVEGDWASIYRLNLYVKGLHPDAVSAREVLEEFERWPTWMWANTDVLNLAEWLREYNSDLPVEYRVGFYGMDVYGHWEAMDDLLTYAGKYLPNRLGKMRDKLACFAAYRDNEWQYARAVANGKPSCFDELAALVGIMDGYSEKLTTLDHRSFFRARQNALVLKNAESFFRLAMVNQAMSWNSRVDHMWQTVIGLKELYGDGSRGIVWAHNTHVGDSRATTMGLHGQYNIGRLSRAGLGIDNVFVVGFGSSGGRVNAGSEWGSPVQVMRVPPAIPGSLDYYLGKTGHHKSFVMFTNEHRNNPLFAQTIGHRAIGVVYDPAREAGNYVPTLPAHRYDALIFFKETSALTPVE